MAARRHTLASARRVERAAGKLSTAAVQRMNAELDWFRELPAEPRSWVGLVAQAGVHGFTEWLRSPDGPPPLSVFGAAPRELARLVTLQQAVQLVRITVETVEQHVPELAAPGEEEQLLTAVLRFSREVAFAAAHVYASAAEERGAWHARQQALLLDALVRDEPADALQARGATLGWGTPRTVRPLVGSAPEGDPEVVIDEAERLARVGGAEALAGLQGDRLLLLLASRAPSNALIHRLLDAFGKGPVVIGAAAHGIALAAPAVRDALEALRVAGAWPDAPRPVPAEDLVAERALNGDTNARARLEDIYNRLLEAGGAVLDTVAAYLDHGGSVEATARSMYLHPNTVRYRLQKSITAVGLSAYDPRDAFTLQVAIRLGRLAAG
ncbi:MAG: PucR family transcriptional regulator [Mycobacteriales bacterium]|nr:helix-turn-helix domain-containing protein [Frankia sp.]